MQVHIQDKETLSGIRHTRREIMHPAPAAHARDARQIGCIEDVLKSRCREHLHSTRAGVGV